MPPAKPPSRRSDSRRASAQPGREAANGPSVRPMMHAVGTLVRRLRTDAGMSLAALAASAELSPGLLSEIERGQGNPSFATLIKLAHALGVPVGRFFVSQRPEGALLRKGRHPRLLLSEEDLVYELLTPHMNGLFGMIKAQVAAGWSNRDVPFQHEGEECIYILHGELVITVGDECHTVSEGDSLTYDPSLPHWYENRTAHDAILVGAMSPPSF
jgi:transcriptional regulator with XRE-family HTH domain